MSKDLYDRFTYIKRTLEQKEKQQTHLQVVPKADLVSEFLNSECNNRICDDFLRDSTTRYNFELNSNVTDNDVNQLLKEIKGEYDSERLNLLIEDCKTSVLDSIIKPFGIAGIIFEDKIGGNVDTVHNAREGTYATDENKKNYENRGDYDSHRYHGHENYKQKNREASECKEQGELKDAYRDKDFKRNDKSDLDHTISAKEIHDDPGRVLAGLDGEDLANEKSNLNVTDRSVNRSKKAKSVDEFIKHIEATREQRQEKIKELESKRDLSDKERKELNKLKKIEEIDVDKLKQKDDEARKEYEKKVNQTYYTSSKFIKNVGKTSLKEGMKMGVQQALGIMMREFTLAVFSEIEDIFSKRHEIIINNAFLNSLKGRLEKIAERVMSKWKDVVKAFGEGAISGFFSNIITVIINLFFTTSKKITRIIREGFYSLLKALKMLFFPLQNMSRDEAAHEATKLIASGLVIIGGIAIEEVLEKALLSIPVIGMLSDIIAPVIMGIVTGLSMALITYLIDKIDLFKVNANKRQEYISNQLSKMIDENLEEIDDAYNYIINPVVL